MFTFKGPEDLLASIRLFMERAETQATKSKPRERDWHKARANGMSEVLELVRDYFGEGRTPPNVVRSSKEWTEFERAWKALRVVEIEEGAGVSASWVLNPRYRAARERYEEAERKYLESTKEPTKDSLHPEGI